MSLSTVLAWLWANHTHLLELLTGIVTAASLFVKALELLVAALTAQFPHLQGVDGELKGAAAFLDRLAKAPFLNSLAFNPKRLQAVVVPFLLVGLLSGSAQAAPIVSSGPTLPLMEVRPGNPHPVSLAAGAGYQVSFTFPELQRAIGGRAWDLLDFNAMAFGSVVSSKSGATFGALSAAVGLCTLSSLLCGGIGHDVVTAPGLSPGWFFLFSASINIEVGPTAPPVGVAPGTRGMLRGNTLYLGGA